MTVPPIPDFPVPPTAPTKTMADAVFSAAITADLAYRADELVQRQAFVLWAQYVMDAVLATALAGDLPSLSGAASKFLHVDAGETGLEFLSGYLVGIQQSITVAGAGTWLRPTGCTGLLIDGVGGGGGGGGAASSGAIARAASGGGAGTWGLLYLPLPPASLDFVVGAAGVGGGLGDNAGSDAGDTTIASLGLILPGGGGGPGSGTSSVDQYVTPSGARGAPIVEGSCTLLGVARGESGACGLKLSTTNRMGGRGGMGRWGQAGPSRFSTVSGVPNNGNEGVGNGVGGGGGVSSTANNASGGAGTPGQLNFIPLFG